MRVAMFVPRGFPKKAGSERQALQLSLRLLKMGMEVWILTPRYPGQPYREAVEGLQVVRLPAFGWSRLPYLRNKIAVFFSCLSFLVYFLFRRKRFDILHFHGADPCSALGSFLAFLSKKKTIVKVATSGPYGDIAGLDSSLLGGLQRFLLLRFPPLFISISEEVKRELIEMGVTEERIVSIPNGIDIERFHPVDEEEKRNGKRALSLDDRKVITYVGRLVKRKGVDLLISSMVEVAKICPEAMLLIIGEGEEEAPLRNLALQKGLDEEHIRFLGGMEDVRPYLRITDVFVLPSRGEGLSNSLLEAMATGLPIVATSVGGTLEMLRHGENAFLVKPENIKDLQEALLSLLREDGLGEALGLAARKTVEERYSLDKVAQEHARLYDSLLD